MQRFPYSSTLPSFLAVALCLAMPIATFSKPAPHPGVAGESAPSAQADAYSEHDSPAMPLGPSFLDTTYSQDLPSLLKCYAPNYPLLGVLSLSEQRLWSPPTQPSSGNTLPSWLNSHVVLNWSNILDPKACRKLDTKQRQSLLAVPDLLFASNYTEQIVRPEKILFLAYDGEDCPSGFCIDKVTKAVGVHILPNELALAKHRQKKGASQHTTVANTLAAASPNSQPSGSTEKATGSSLSSGSTEKAMGNSQPSVSAEKATGSSQPGGSTEKAMGSSQPSGSTEKAMGSSQPSGSTEKAVASSLEDSSATPPTTDANTPLATADSEFQGDTPAPNQPSLTNSAQASPEPPVPRTALVETCLLNAENVLTPVVIDSHSNCFHHLKSPHAYTAGGVRAYADLSTPYDDFFAPCPECFPDLEYIRTATREEISEARQIWKLVRTQNLIADSPIADELQELLVKLQRNAPLSNRQAKITILNSPVANTLKSNAGDVYITTALLESTTDNMQLVACLAHELAHSELKHNYKKGVFNSRYQDPLLPILEAFLPFLDTQYCTESLEETDDALHTIGGYDSADDHNADILTLIIAFSAGYDPQECLNSLVQLEQLSEKAHKAGVTWSESHDPGTARQKTLTQVAEKLNKLGTYVDYAIEHNDYELALALRRQAALYYDHPETVDNFMAAYGQLTLLPKPRNYAPMIELYNSPQLSERFDSWREELKHAAAQPPASRHKPDRRKGPGSDAPRWQATPRPEEATTPVAPPADNPSTTAPTPTDTPTPTATPAATEATSSTPQPK